MDMLKALLRMGVAAGAKAAAEPMRREAIASFMLTVFFQCRNVRSMVCSLAAMEHNQSTDVQG